MDPSQMSQTQHQQQSDVSQHSEDPPDNSSSSGSDTMKLLMLDRWATGPQYPSRRWNHTSLHRWTYRQRRPPIQTRNPTGCHTYPRGHGTMCEIWTWRYWRLWGEKTGSSSVIWTRFWRISLRPWAIEIIQNRFFFGLSQHQVIHRWNWRIDQ